MAEKDKKYYWLKLKRDFFKRHDIQIIEGMPNGKDYILFYLKLLCESVDHDGNLRFSEEIPYNEEMLATITNTNVDIVRSAVKLFVGLHMMEVMNDGTYYMSQVQKMIGSETYWAQKKREQKERKAIDDKSVGKFPTVSNEFPMCPSKSIEKELDIEIDVEIEKRVDCQQVVDLFHSLCKSFPTVRTLTDARKKAIKARLNTYTLDDFETVFTNAEKSSFLKGGNERNWIATFDWLIKDSNMAKVLEGNYEDKPKRNGRKEVTPHWCMDDVDESVLKYRPVFQKTAGNDAEVKAKAEALQEKLKR